MQLSYWEKTAFLKKDFIVVGAGITGLLTAILLAKKHPKNSVLVLERGIFPSGATSRNAGFACFGSPSELLNDLQNEGKDKMLQLVQQRWEGLQKLLTLTRKKAIDFLNYGGYELIPHDDPHQVIPQLDHLNELLKPLFPTYPLFVHRSNNIDSFQFNPQKVAHLIYNPYEGQIHSGKLILTLWRIAYQLGVQIISNTKVFHLEPDGQKVKVYVKPIPFEDSIAFEAQKVIVCNNAFASHLLPELQVIPGRGIVLVTKPISKLRMKGTFHFDSGFIYFRNIENRILIGGARNLFLHQEKTYDMSVPNNVKQYLFEYMKEYFTFLPSESTYETLIEHEWAGLMGFGDTKLPMVQEVKPNIFAAVKFSGMGVALAYNAAEKVVQQVNDSL